MENTGNTKMRLSFICHPVDVNIGDRVVKQAVVKPSNKVREKHSWLEKEREKIIKIYEKLDVNEKKTVVNRTQLVRVVQKPLHKYFLKKKVRAPLVGEESINLQLRRSPLLKDWLKKIVEENLIKPLSLRNTNK